MSLLVVLPVLVFELSMIKYWQIGSMVPLLNLPKEILLWKEEEMCSVDMNDAEQGSSDFIKMNQNKLFGFKCSENGTAYSGLFAVKTSSELRNVGNILVGHSQKKSH